jgi:hypothetical protein
VVDVVVVFDGDEVVPVWVVLVGVEEVVGVVFTGAHDSDTPITPAVTGREI